MSKNKSIWASIVGVLTSILAFLGIVSCCGMPIIAGVLSLLGIGASQLSFFAEYKWWFIVLSIVCLTWGFVQLYGKKNSCCCSCGTDNSNKDTKSSKQLVAKIFLWIGTLLTAFVIIYNLSAGTSPSDSCCSEESSIPVQSGCCSATADETEIEFENRSSAPSCCGSDEGADTKNNCCSQN